MRLRRSRPAGDRARSTASRSVARRRTREKPDARGISARGARASSRVLAHCATAITTNSDACSTTTTSYANRWRITRRAPFDPALPGHGARGTMESRGRSGAASSAAQKSAPRPGHSRSYHAAAPKPSSVALSSIRSVGAGRFEFGHALAAGIPRAWASAPGPFRPGRCDARFPRPTRPRRHRLMRRPGW